MGHIHIGTSGWTYPHWRGPFYPSGLPARRWLAWLAERLSTIEINGTFYSLLRPAAFERWRAEVPPGFVFAIKASRYITHMLKLGGGAAPLANFFAQGVLCLGAQLGPILWQLPPQLPFHHDRAARFLAALPACVRDAEHLAAHHDHRLDGRAVTRAPDGRDAPLRHAFEVRHPSWLDDESLALLGHHGVALVVADTAGRHPFSLARTTAPFSYLRLHGSRVLYGSQYTDGELDDWAARIRVLRRHGDVYTYFDNDRLAYAPTDALRLLDRLETPMTRGHPPPP